MTETTIKIGTRGSPLARTQTALVEAALKAAHPRLSVAFVIIKTSGDWRPEHGETKLSEVEGGKGLFAREIENSLLRGEIDCAVHSLKDMPSFLTDGLALDHMLERDDPRDAFISHKASRIEDLPEGATVGTSSIRRQSILLAKRPDLNVVPLRGNVQTRLSKLADGVVDATFLAVAGLKRLGLEGDYIHPISCADMMPACGQGIVAIETREGDSEIRAFLDHIHHHQTGLLASAERAALQVLDGSCHTPIGAHARFEGDVLRLDLMVAWEDGRRIYSEVETGGATDTEAAEAIGRAAAERLKKSLPPKILT